MSTIWLPQSVKVEMEVTHVSRRRMITDRRPHALPGMSAKVGESASTEDHSCSLGLIDAIKPGMGMTQAVVV